MIQISENGVWYHHPVKLLTETTLPEAVGAGRLNEARYAATLEKLRSVIDRHIVWDIDDSGNLIPSTMAPHDRLVVAAHAVNCLVEQVPVVTGPGERTADWNFWDSIVAGSVELVADESHKGFNLSKVVALDTQITGRVRYATIV